METSSEMAVHGDGEETKPFPMTTVNNWDEDTVEISPSEIDAGLQHQTTALSSSTRDATSGATTEASASPDFIISRPSLENEKLRKQVRSPQQATSKKGAARRRNKNKVVQAAYDARKPKEGRTFKDIGKVESEVGEEERRRMLEQKGSLIMKMIILRVDAFLTMLSAQSQEQHRF